MLGSPMLDSPNGRYESLLSIPSGESRTLSFLTDDEATSLTIRRMILHVVGGEEDFEAQAEQDEIEHKAFFLKRIKNAAIDGVHEFQPESDTKQRLEHVAMQQISFERAGQDLSRAFSLAHVGASAAGAFFVFELGVNHQDTSLYSMVKYDYRNVLELVSKAGRQSLRSIVQAFVTEGRAIQKSCLVRVRNGKAEPLVSAFDRMGTSPDLTDYFRKFLGVGRTRSDDELSANLNEMIRSALTTCKPMLPGRNVVAALDRTKESLRGRPIVDESAIREAIFVGCGSPKDQDSRDELNRATTSGLKRHRLTGVEFRPSPGVLAQRPRRQIKTAESVVLSYPGEEEGRSVRKEQQPDGGWIITIRTQRELVEDGTLPAKAGRDA